ncbi:MAG TPA: hypothetical protein VFC25_09130 [Verrucomicrobiae bacterium]|jgi:hypothetical protein|nr:hypothetical protein [Verrucomicrobiae bacterium]
MRPMLRWSAVLLIALVLPGISPGPSVPNDVAFASSPAPAQVDTIPTQCLAERNHGTCVECCKEITHCGEPPALFPCNVCAKFCQNNVPPPPEPQPEPQP